MIRLKVLLPTEVLLDACVKKVIAEAENGQRCFLPRHIDFVASLVPGILSFELESGEEGFIAIDEGILVKCGDEVLVSTLNGVRDDNLSRLKQTVEEQFQVLDDLERQTRSALAKFEANIIRKFQELSI